MPSLPGWDSIESVNAIAKFFHIAGLAAIVLLALFEVIAYVYDHHKENLVALASVKEASERAQHDADSKRKLDEAQTKIAAAEKEAHNAQNAVDTIKEAALPRHLTDQQKADLAKFLADQPKGKFTIKADTNARDGRQYADEIAAFFNSPMVSWSVKVENAIIMGDKVNGIWITVRDADANKAPVAAGVLQRAFKVARMEVRGQYDPTGPAPDEFWLSIGLKQ
jgi:hypothetical protein